MHQHDTARTDTARRGDALASQCHTCRNEVDVHVVTGHVTGPGDEPGAITYADTDIVVWDCPGCGSTNADTLEEW
jgi:hypothetical protein